MNLYPHLNLLLVISFHSLKHISMPSLCQALYQKSILGYSSGKTKQNTKGQSKEILEGQGREYD